MNGGRWSPERSHFLLTQTAVSGSISFEVPSSSLQFFSLTSRSLPFTPTLSIVWLLFFVCHCCWLSKLDTRILYCFSILYIRLVMVPPFVPSYTTI